MTALIFKLLGGIGLFLMGMVLLSDGLKAFAGEALRRGLASFTGTPGRAIASGALVTAMVQSSSATTITVIGFVSAGLLTFPQAIGVVLGASLGTTGTGWIISLLGLKISIGYYSLPLVGVGAFMKLLGRGRIRSLGEALAGFALIFIGIDNLQDAMAGLSGVFDLAAIPSRGLGGHLLAMLIGLVMTVLMMSSSAAVATTLTALHAGAINFEQAASLVIGAAVGTTVTGVLAAIGGNVPAKRTALAHVLFNLATGVIALVLLPVFLWGLGQAQARDWLEPGAMSLAAFHSAFIALGVLLFLPWVDPFARAIERLLPEPSPTLTRHLDDSVLQTPAVAVEATRRALAEVAAASLALLRARLADPPGAEAADALTRLRGEFACIEAFFPRIPPGVEGEPLSERRVALMHAIDHLARLQARLELPDSFRRVRHRPELTAVLTRVRELLALGENGLREQAPGDWHGTLERQAFELADLRAKERPRILQSTAGGAAGPGQALDLLDAMRVLDRIANHAWRICHYLHAEQERKLADSTTHPDE